MLLETRHMELTPSVPLHVSAYSISRINQSHGILTWMRFCHGSRLASTHLRADLQVGRTNWSIHATVTGLETVGHSSRQPSMVLVTQQPSWNRLQSGTFTADRVLPGTYCPAAKRIMVVSGTSLPSKFSLRVRNGPIDERVSRAPDSYHTCYALAGLSLTQHLHYFEQPNTSERFASVITWKAIQGDRVPCVAQDPNVSDETDRVRAVHPVYAISHEAVESMRRWAMGLEGF